MTYKQVLKSVASAAAAAGMLVVAGCAGSGLEAELECESTGRCDETDTLDSVVEIQWLFDDSNGVCPAESVVRVTSTDVHFGDTFVELFDCADGSGSFALVPGDYDITVDLFDDLSIDDPSGADSFFFGSSGTVPLVDASFDTFVDAPLEFAYGFFAASWSINGEIPDEFNCADIGGTSMLTTLVGPDLATDDIFNCIDGGAVTDELELGDYTVVLSFLDAADAVIADNTFSESLSNHDEVVDLEHFDLQD